MLLQKPSALRAPGGFFVFAGVPPVWRASRGNLEKPLILWA
ncbi:hypothetical protein [Paraburkholderia heleia]|nr:hypothetical protein [Paraburkholderia heleia]